MDDIYVKQSRPGTDSVAAPGYTSQTSNSQDNVINKGLIELQLRVAMKISLTRRYMISPNRTPGSANPIKLQ